MVQTQPDRPPVTPPDDDPLASLHKMSITAGLGSGEYVAVNGAAVFAVLLGLASALSLMNELLLIIPLAGVMVSIVAWRQISRSSGTQTGRGLVVLALLLALGFGGSVFGLKIRDEVRTREDRQAIRNVVAELAEDAKSQRYDAAYSVFSSRFRSAIKLGDFTDKIKFLRENSVYGQLKGADTGLMEFQTDEATGARFAVVRVLFDFEKTNRPLPDALVFRKEGDHWYIESFQTLFPPPKPAQ